MGHLGADAVAANSIANIVKDLLVCLSLGLGNAGGIFGRQSAGTWRFPTGEGDGRQDVRAGGRGRYRDGTVDCRGASAGFAMGEPYARSHTVPVGHAVRLRILRGMRMHDESDDRRYFSAGGDAKFGLMCDAIVMWLIVVPVGLLAAFVFKLPVLVVYALLNTDECIKMVPRCCTTASTVGCAMSPDDFLRFGGRFHDWLVCDQSVTASMCRRGRARRPSNTRNGRHVVRVCRYPFRLP